MKIEKFTEKDIPEAVKLTVEAWNEAIGQWDRRVAHVVCEYSVRDEFLNPDYALKITENGEMLGFILAATASDTNCADDWLHSRRGEFTDCEHLEILDIVEEASHSNESLVLRNMVDGDAMLTFFLSTRPGCGRLLLNEMCTLLSNDGYRNLLLWTDITCNHQYYPKHGFSLVDEQHFQADGNEEPFTVFIYKKPL